MRYWQDLTQNGDLQGSGGLEESADFQKALGSQKKTTREEARDENSKILVKANINVTPSMIVAICRYYPSVYNLSLSRGARDALGTALPRPPLEK